MVLWCAALPGASEREGTSAVDALTTAPCPGLLCHLNDACISNPCNEGSNCDTNPVNGKAICTCPSGYTGPACSQDVDECSLGMRMVGAVPRK